MCVADVTSVFDRFVKFVLKEVGGSPSGSFPGNLVLGMSSHRTVCDSIFLSAVGNALHVLMCSSRHLETPSPPNRNLVRDKPEAQSSQ